MTDKRFINKKLQELADSDKDYYLVEMNCASCQNLGQVHSMGNHRGFFCGLKDTPIDWDNESYYANYNVKNSCEDYKIKKEYLSMRLNNYPIVLVKNEEIIKVIE